MRKLYAYIRLGALLALIALLAWLAFHPFTRVSADPPIPTPTFQVEEIELEENQSLTDSQISPTGVITTGVNTFYAAADTQVLQGHPTTNYGTSSTMRAGYDACPGETPGIDRSLVRFDLSHVPPGTTINSARLDLYYSGSCGYSGQSLSITPYQITSDWQEESVTWNTKPSPGNSYGSVSILHGAWGWYSFNVTDLVRSWVNGTGNYGIMLRGPETATGWRKFDTKGAGRYTYGPRLVVDLELPPPTLGAAPSSLEFTNDASGPTVQTKDLIVQNLGDDTLNWSASESVSWLSLDKTGGTTQFTLPDTIRVSANKSSLSTGIYTGQIQITSNPPGAPGSPKLVTVTLSLVDKFPRVYLPIVFKSGGSTCATNIVALIIGVSDYEHMPLPGGQTFGRAGIPGTDVMHSYDDAKEFHNMMSSKGSLGLADSKVLLDSFATKEAIRRAIVYWLNEREDVNTMVVIFFSGHGMSAPDDGHDEADGYDEFIVPYDVEYDEQLGMWRPETAIRDDELDTWLDELESSCIVLMVDSCFSGGIAAGATASDRGLLSRADLGMGAADLQASDSFAQDVSAPGRVVLMASAADQGSWEFSELEHGVFTYYLLQALSSTSADTNHNGYVSAEEAFSYLVNRVDSYVWSKTGDHQNPQISDGATCEANLTRP